MPRSRFNRRKRSYSMKLCATSQTKFSIVFFQIGNVNCRMGDQIHVLAQQIFGKSSVQECSLQEIRELTQRYPYFAPAQFLLLEKLRQEGSPEYGEQLQ